MSALSIVSDPGVDDILALVLLERLAAKREKLLISTFGNCNASVSEQNCQAFVGLMQGGWRYMQGARLPRNGKVERPWATNYHGPDGLWGVGAPGSFTMGASPEQAPPNEVVSLGPLTEPYRLLQTGSVQKLTIMGGTFRELGNETDCTEFNIAMDPDAARLLFSTCRNIDVRVVPMDATRHVVWSQVDVQRIPETSSLNCWLKRLLLAWFQNYEYASEKGFVLYDPLTIYLMFFPEAADWLCSGIEVGESGSVRGQTYLSDTSPPCRIAMSIPKPQKVAKDIFAILFD